MVSPSTRPTAARLETLAASMGAHSVLLLADLVADRFLTGTPKRISREAPVLILRQDEDLTVPGGGANAAANVASLGGTATLLGAVGTDASGLALLAELNGRGVDTSRVAQLAHYRTPTKTRILGGGRHSIKQQIVRFDLEDQLDEDDTTTQAILGNHHFDRGPATPVTIVSDYGYGAATPSLVTALRQRLGEAIFLCDSRFRLGSFRGIDAATPNEEEVEQLLGHSLDPDAAHHCLELRDRLGLRFLLVTRGSAGMMLAYEDQVAIVPVHGTDEVADVTGAGDTVIATFALALAAGASALEATVLANYAGGIVVMKRGTATVSAAELTDAIRRDPVPLEQLTWA